MKSDVRALRIVGIIEGWSYLLLLFIAMPLKYWADLPIYVTVVGMMHGVLFVLFGVALLVVWIKRRWSFLWALGAFVSSLIPFGTFVLDAKLKRHTG